MRKPIPPEERCSEPTVWTDPGWRSRQCRRRGTVTEGGKRWCRQHVPSAVTKREVERNARYEAEHKREQAPFEEAKRLRSINKDLLEALEPFDALLQPHLEATAYEGDATGVFGINQAKITVGDLRRARAAIKKARES